MTPPRVFAIVVTFNGGEVTRDCVSSLQQGCHADLSILVVDNASTKVEQADLHARWDGEPDIEVITLLENRHFAGGVNAGAARALADGATHLFFLNNDTVIEPGCIDLLLQEATENPEAGIYGPALLDLGDRHAISLGERYAAWSLALPRAVLRVRSASASSYPVGGIMGSAILVSADCLRQVGPYREDLLVYYEEVDFCLRARALGFQPHIVSDAIVLHDGMRGFTSGLQPYAARLKIRNQLRLAYDHGGWPGFLIFFPTFLALLMGSTIVYVWRGDGPTVRALWAGLVEGLSWLWRGRL